MATTSPSEDELQQLAVRLDAAALGAKDTNEMLARLTLTDDERQGALGALKMAFQYGTARSPKPGEPYFTELFGYEDGSRHPPQLSELPATISDLWSRSADVVDTPMARARLHDLCFEGRWGNVGDHARRAGDAYLELANEMAAVDVTDQLRAVRALRQCDALRRARSLARLTRQDMLGQRAGQVIAMATRDLLTSAPLDPGRAIVLVELAIDESLPDKEIDDLLVRLRAEDCDVFFTERVIRLQLRRSPDDETRVKLQRALVEAWMAEAERSDLARRVWSLTSAAERAQAFGLSDLLAELTSKLQETKIEDHGLVRRRVEVPVDQADAESYVQSFLELADWRDALLKLTSGDPPTGSVARNRANADLMAQLAPLQASLPTTLLGGDGLPRFTAATDDEKAEYRLTRCELAHLQVLGSFVDEILRRIGLKWGPIPEDELTAFLGQAVYVPVAVAATIARAFNRYFADDFEAVGYIVTPQVERLVRDAVLAVNEPAYRLQRGQKPGQYAGLGALLPILQNAGIDESWVRFLHTALAATPGFNFRNDLLHGFVDQVRSGHAALVLLAALYLTRGFDLSVAPPADGDGETKE